MITNSFKFSTGDENERVRGRGWGPRLGQYLLRRVVAHLPGLLPLQDCSAGAVSGEDQVWYVS